MSPWQRVPPGRAARLRLRRSLAVAEHGAGLLDRKLRVLRAEHRRRLLAQEAAERQWQDRLREAERWLLRALLLSGERALDAAAAVGPAEIAVEWGVSMGVRHPAAVRWVPPVLAPEEAAPANSAVQYAQAAYGEAVRAAADYAAARTAARAIGAEVDGTRRRVRALRRHWIPRLGAALAAVDLALEQNEHEDAVRRRWAAGGGPGRAEHGGRQGRPLPPPDG